MIYIIIVILAGVTVAFIIVMMLRSIIGRHPSLPRQAAAPTVQEKESPQQELVGQPASAEAESPPSSPPEPLGDVASVEAESPPSAQPEQAPGSSAVQAAAQETTVPGLQEDAEEPGSLETKGNQEDSLLNVFKAEATEDTGLSALAESLEDVGIHRLTKLTKEVSRLLGGQ